MTIELTHPQLNALALAGEEWTPFPSKKVSRITLYALRDKRMILLRPFPLSWRLNPNRPRAAVAKTDFQEFLEAIRNARRRAGQKNRDCELTPDLAKRLWDRCAGCCELTGIPFDFSHNGGMKRPFAPSIDRVDSTKGYTESNVRVVCTAVNIAMNQWGEGVLTQIAEGLLRSRLSPAYPREDKLAA